MSIARCPSKRLAAQAALLVLCLLLSGLQRTGAQNLPDQQHPVLPKSIGRAVSGNLDDNSNGNAADNERLLRTLNADRQKSMIADTNKLLRLVNELNAEVASTNPDSLTAAQLHKVAEIEKLAHNVKDKMSTSVRGTPAFQQPHLLLR